jgi:hypothetical protein
MLYRTKVPKVLHHNSAAKIVNAKLSYNPETECFLISSDNVSILGVSSSASVILHICFV